MPEQTIRQYLEAIRDAAYIEIHGSYATNLSLTKQFYQYAVAAIHALDNAKFDVLSISESGDRSTLRRSVPDPLGPDPEPRDA